jgi:hypothetical protein
MLALLFGTFISASTLWAQVRVDQYVQETATKNFEFVFDNYLGYGDDIIRSLTMPFAFNYDGTNYPSGTRLYVSHNGWVKFGSSSSGYNTVGNSSYPGHIAAFAEDQVSSIYYGVSGSSPNRVLTVMYYSMTPYQYYNYQYINVRLFESTNAIEFNYLYKNNYHARASGIGLNGNTTGGFRTKVYSYGTNYTPSQDIRYRPPVSDKPALTVTGGPDVDFGQLPLGATQTACITVTNTGTPGEPGAPANPLIFQPAALSGASDYTLSSVPATPLNIGESAQYCVTFSPVTPGVLNSTLEIKTNALQDPNKTIQFTGVGLAPVMSVEQKYLFRKSYTKAGYQSEQGFAIENKGNAPLTITSVELTGDYADQYQISRAPQAPIPPGMIDSVYVLYSPIYEGLRTADLTIHSDGFATGSHTVILWGTGIIPRLAVTPDEIASDSVLMGDTAWYTVRLTNVGSDTVVIYDDYFASADADFMYKGLLGTDSLIVPDSYREVLIGFAPQTRGTRQARLRLLTNLPPTFEATPRDTSTFNVDFTVVGVPSGLLYVEGPTTIDSSRVGTEICRPVTIFNNGQESLTVNAATISGADASDFTIKGATFPLTIAANGSTTVQVCATPSARGLRTASIAIEATSSGQTSTVDLPLMVFGQLVCAQPSTAIAFENEVVLVNTTSTAQVLVNNCGDIPMTYTATVAGAGYSLTGAATSSVIAPGDNATFEVSFNPTVMSSLPGTLTITGDGIADMVVQLAGTGGNVMITAADNIAPETAIGSTSPEFNVTVTNTGNMQLTPGEPTISNTEFAYVSGSGPTTIDAGQSGTYKFTFTPAQEGNRTANVTFPSASPALTSGFVLNGSTPLSGVRPVAAQGYSLRQNYPNPFNPSTVITFTMAEAGMAKIIVTDVTGNLVTTVADQFFAKGENMVTFDASSVASGTYFYELVADGVRLQRSMILNK